jgi:hypothetical protein
LEIDVEMEAQDMVKSQMKLLFKKNYQIFNWYSSVTTISVYLKLIS